MKTKMTSWLLSKYVFYELMDYDHMKKYTIPLENNLFPLPN